MDFQQQCFIFGELKSITQPLTVGQKIHLEGLVKAIRDGGRMAYAFLAWHDTKNCEHDVRVADAEVRLYFDGTYWKKIEGTTVNSFIEDVYSTYKDTAKGEIAQ
jgi:hypothetical protein